MQQDKKTFMQQEFQDYNKTNRSRVRQTRLQQDRQDVNKTTKITERHVQTELQQD